MPESPHPQADPHDLERRELARSVRQLSVEALRDAMEEAGVTRAFVVFENGQFRLSHPDLLRPVRAFFELSHDFADHEAVFLGRQPGIPGLFLASVHDTRRGLAQGGLRFARYPNVAEMLVDGLRLAQGMTRKNALAGLWWGGGKGIVAITDEIEGDEDYFVEGTEKRLALFRAYGRFVASLGGIYYTAEDVGTKTSDMNAILGQNRFTTCVAADLGGSGNPSPFTARGVFKAQQAAWRFLTGSDDLDGVAVAVQGVGNVGGPLVDLLHEAGARLYLTDADEDALERYATKYPDAEIVGLAGGGPDAIYDVPVEIFAPCAIGAVVNRDTIPRLQARLVCGAANNVLREPADAERLRRRGIAYVPDYLCNRMGITNCCDEWQGYLPDDVALAAERVYPDTLRVLQYARSQLITSAAAADQLADLAACELHPMMGHRGRRIVDRLVRDGWHRGAASQAETEAEARSDDGADDQGGPRPAFDPGADEPSIRARWEQRRIFRGMESGEGRSFAAAPISAAGRPDLSTLLSALLMDVRARAHVLAARDEDPTRPLPRLLPRRILGGDPGGLALQLAVERSLPFERADLGRSRFAEHCLDHQRKNDAAVREQLHLLGVGFDPRSWIDPMGRETEDVVRRLFQAFGDAGRLRRERRMTFYDPSTQTVLISPDVSRTRVEVDERFTVRFTVSSEGPSGDHETDETDEAIEVQTFYPELLAGAAAVAVRADGPWGELDGAQVVDPLRSGEDERATLPVFAVDDLATDAKVLVPAHDRDDAEILAERAEESAVEGRPVIDERGLALLPGEPPLERAQARRLVEQRLGSAIRREEGSWWVDAFRARRSETLVNWGRSEQLFVDLEDGARRLRRAIDSGAVTFSDPHWRDRALRHLEPREGDTVEPWCISRQYWWGHPVPGDAVPGPSDERDDVLSVWFTLAAWALRAVGWPGDPEPAPIDEVWVDAELFERWALLAQMVCLSITGRPAFRRVQVHGSLHVTRRELAPRPDVEPEEVADAPDEERFVLRPTRRPMRRRLGNAVEPATLIRRFGADALRLGYLLSLQAGSSDVATVSESHLRRARRTVHRLESKVTGLFHRTRHAVPTAVPDCADLPLGDLWILGRCRRAVEDARKSYDDERLDRVGRRLAAAADDLTRYARLAVERLDAVEDEDDEAVAAAVVRRTVSTALSVLAEGFEPVAPYLFEHLPAWAAKRGEPWSRTTDWAPALADALDAVRARRGDRRRIGATAPEILEVLRRDDDELERLAGGSVDVSEVTEGPEADDGVVRVD